jgi:hypothetical protein
MTNKTILFRASSIGNLMVDGRGVGITENQLKEIEELKNERETGLNVNGNKVKWTEVKNKKLSDLIAKRDAPPELSDTAKSEVEKIWLLMEKGFYEELGNKFIMKGLLCEEDGLEMISELDNEFYVKNDERVTIGNITGEADVVHEIDGKILIKDIKSNYSPKTFMNAELSNVYEWQLITYMYLYDAEEAHLEYTLCDLPPHLLEAEIWKAKSKYGIIDEEEESAKRVINQIRTNFTYSTNPNYTLEERRKQFVIYRDKEKEAKLLERIKLALEYYKTLTLNKK